uniref:SET domain-containing protein n=1 Tax=Xenopus tropicalis TaxID=8364 RepID=A0A803K763_XENTR
MDRCVSPGGAPGSEKLEMLKEQCKEISEMYEDLLRGNTKLRREIQSLTDLKDNAKSEMLELEEVCRLKVNEAHALDKDLKMLQKEECSLSQHLEGLTGTLLHLFHYKEHMIQWQSEISQEASSLLHATKATSNEKMLQQTTKEPQGEDKKTKKLKDVLCGDNCNFKISDFQEKGRGVVTLKLFKKEDLILQYKGNLLKYREGKETEETYFSDESIGCYMLFFKHKGATWCLDATVDDGSLGRLLNHSLKGNCTPKLFIHEGESCVIFVAV